MADTRLSLRRRRTDPFPSTPSQRAARPPSPEANGIVRRPKRAGRRLNYTDELLTELPPEPNHWTEAKWKVALASFLRYIDDGFCLAKVNYENSYGFEVNGVKFRVKHALQSQNVFRHIVRNAEDIGMVLNAAKTAMMCVSGATEYRVDAFLVDSDQNRIGCGQSIKALGVRFSNRLDMENHVKYIEKAVRARYWTLRNLKKNGFTNDELVQVFKTMIRPVAEYACAVFHSSLTDEQDERLERLQDHALKTICGPELSARRLRGLAGVDTLRERREEICIKFALKCSRDPVFAHWFPLRQGRRSTRNG